MKLHAQWDKDYKNNPNYLTKKFNLFPSCLQGIATTKLDLCVAKYDGNRHTDADLKKCLCYYLKAVIKYIGYQVICWL